ncbi:hypothetical protein D3C85_1593480 [compost metagenome]
MKVAQFLIIGSQKINILFHIHQIDDTIGTSWFIGIAIGYFSLPILPVYICRIAHHHIPILPNVPIQAQISKYTIAHETIVNTIG